MVVRPYAPGADPDHARAVRIGRHILDLSAADVALELARVTEDFAARHLDVADLFRRRFRDVAPIVLDGVSAGGNEALLIGAYFSQEYTYEAAALFNPSIVPHPDQTGLAGGAIRFVLSLRAVGEGHVSSIAFRTGVLARDGSIMIDTPGPQAIVPRIASSSLDAASNGSIRMERDDAYGLSETVIFPSTPNQRNGIEDLRLVRFVDDDGSSTYLGTYTAYSSDGINQELLSTRDFRTFDMSPMRGTAARGKGMALFPRRLDGRYAMLGRHDNETISLSYSSSLYDWDAGAAIVAPRYPWEFVQIGNCGSPIEIAEGWLVITHGVGAMRNYALGACLLDRRDPSKLLCRLAEPFIRPHAGERAGYVPNVTYSCGAMVQDRTLILPYAVADSVTTFATIPLDQLLAAME
ncbi:glycoside hydrolase family 130 protein [Sphingomonas montana]|uniref:glycoside hydrolase family 130 protein n=1 Tax=Sphingomonas montana TaxID=1843236 RepID=UPI00096D6BBC